MFDHLGLGLCLSLGLGLCLSLGLGLGLGLCLSLGLGLCLSLGLGLGLCFYYNIYWPGFLIHIELKIVYNRYQFSLRINYIYVML